MGVVSHLSRNKSVLLQGGVLALLFTLYPVVIILSDKQVLPSLTHTDTIDATNLLLLCPVLLYPQYFHCPHHHVLLYPSCRLPNRQDQQVGP